MWATTRVYSGVADLLCAAKKPARDAGPFRAPREVRHAPDIGQTIFLVRRVFETVLLPHLSDSDARKRSAVAIQGRDRPVGSDYLRQRNENTCHHCGSDTNNLGASWLFHASDSNPNCLRLTKNLMT